ncbi:TonB-dependent receptor [Sorangium sp. So ce119]|uniref:TonB-dependent receptor n=1 Tax=Sorangium sp. So ce119 TaxID=3133279 RepID=UPI003F5F4E21
MKFIFNGRCRGRAWATLRCAVALLSGAGAIGAPVRALGQAAGEPAGAAAEQRPAPQASGDQAGEAAAASAQVAGARPIEVLVTAARRPERIDAVPASVSVLSKEQVQAEAALSNGSLGDALGKLVPGMGLGSETQSSFGQTLRGRKVLVLIDGIPQHTIRNVSRDLQTISPLAVERIEVIRGTTPLYGEGAAGGIVNIITRRPAAEGVQLTTDVAASAAPLDLADSLAGSVAQAVAGKHGRLYYNVHASLEKTTGLFDAEGDRIPPDPHGQGGLGDLWAWSGQWRLGVELSPAERLELSAGYYQNVQDTEFASDPAVDAAPPGTLKARAARGLDLDDPQGTRNAQASATYRNVRALGGEVNAQIYFRNYLSRFFPFDGREAANYRHIVQSQLESQRLGGRFQASTSLPHRLTALYGIDVSGERTAQPVAIMDEEAHDASGGLVFRAAGYRTWVPRMEVGNLAPFVQLQWAATPWLALRAGVREELVTLSVGDYTTLVGNAVEGGRLFFQRPLLHAGAVVTMPAQLSAFVSFAQGYSLPDVGLILRNAPAGSTVESLETEPQLVDAIEVGVRREGRAVTGTVAVFYNTSSLGTSSGGLNAPVVRAPERVYGLEATVDARFLESFRAGAGVSLLEGELDREDDGAYTPLNTYRIPPPKVTAYLGKQIVPDWDVQLQAIYSGARDRFSGVAEPGFGELPVDPFLLLELLSTAEVGPGRLRVGVANLLNQQVMPVTSQLLYSGSNSSHAAGSGMRVSVGYAFTY